MPVSADEAAHLLFCPQANGGSQGADADASGVEDANAIQMGLMRIQKALMEDTISMKKAGLLLYSMQLAMTNVGQTTFGQAKDEEMVRETVDEDQKHSAISKNTKTNGTQRNEAAEEEKGYRGWTRMCAEENPSPIFWKPTPDMYRMDTPEGREAYEACLRRKMEPRARR